MKVKDAEGWEKCKEANKPTADDPGYSQAVLDYAVAWADAIEAELANGKKLDDVAQTCEPKGHGITGFQYGAAVATLSQFWEHGDELRQWHNKEWGQPNAQGTVNPALMVIETRDS